MLFRELANVSLVYTCNKYIIIHKPRLKKKTFKAGIQLHAASASTVSW